MKPKLTKPAIVQAELPKTKPLIFLPETVLKAEKALRTGKDTADLYRVISYCRDTGNKEHYHIASVRAQSRGLATPKILKLIADYVNVNKFVKPKKKASHRKWV